MDIRFDGKRALVTGAGRGNDSFRFHPLNRLPNTEKYHYLSSSPTKGGEGITSTPESHYFPSVKPGKCMGI